MILNCYSEYQSTLQIAHVICVEKLMSSLRIRPRRWEVAATQNDFLDSQTNLVRTSVGSYLSHARPKTGKCDAFNHRGECFTGARPRGKNSMLDQKERRSRCEVWVDAVAQDQEHA